MMKSIRDTIIMRLKQEFPDHTVYGEKVLQGLVRPCFFVDILPIELLLSGPNRQERSLIVDIQYMSQEDTKAKNLEMADTLGQLFPVVEFDGFRVKPDNGRFEIIDGILHYLFDLDFIVLGKVETQDEPIRQVNVFTEIQLESDTIREIHIKEEI